MVGHRVAYGLIWDICGVHLAAGGLHLAAQVFHIQHMAVYAAYGCWLAGHRGHTDLRAPPDWVVKCRSRGPNSKQHYCKQQAAIL